MPSGRRWDEFLFRKHDSFGEDAAEQAAKENLQRLGRRPGEREGAPEEVDTQQMPLLPLQLRPVGDGGAQRSAQSVDARATLQRMALLAAEEGLDAGGSLGDSVPWTNFTDSEMMPLLPYTVGTVSQAAGSCACTYQGRAVPPCSAWAWAPGMCAKAAVKLVHALACARR